MIARHAAVWTMLTVTMLPLVTARAQLPLDSSQDSVPRALVEAVIAPSLQMFGMMMGAGGGRPRLVVGSLPSGLADRLWVPPGASVLGGVESSGMGLGILRTNLSADSLTAAYRREQPSLGWTAPPPRRFTRGWGFAPAPGSDSDPDEALVFCSGGTLLMIGIEPVSAGVQEISARAISVAQDVCRVANSEPDRYPGMRRFHPTLSNPPGTGDGLRADCADFNSSGGGGGTRLNTMSPIDEVLAHYGAQLADSGWTLVTDREIMTRTWTRRDSTGAFIELTLKALRRASHPSCVEVEMETNARTQR